MPCFWCTVDKIPSKNPPCKLCVQEDSSCHTDPNMVTDEHHGPCEREQCKLSQHLCRFVSMLDWPDENVQRICRSHRDLPLDAKKDHYVCSQHLAEQLQLEGRYPSVVMSKCAAPGCLDSRCLPVPGENGVRYCEGHARDRHPPQRPTSWPRKRLDVIQALREAGLHGLPWNVMLAREYPAVDACYKSDNGLLQASLSMLLIESRWRDPRTSTPRNHWSLEGERRCMHRGPRGSGIGRCARPSQGEQLCALHGVHQQAEPKLVALLLGLRSAHAAFYWVFNGWPLSLQRAFLVDCLWE